MIVILYNADVAPASVGGGKLVAHKSVMNCVIAVERALGALVGRGHYAGPVVTLPVGADLDELRSELLRLRPDFVFHTCEAVGGDSRGEQWVAVLLNRLGIAHSGGSPESLGLCLDKFKAKRALERAGVPTPFGFLAESTKLNGSTESAMTHFPLIVKPVHEDGSIGISDGAVVRDVEALERRIRYVLRRFRQPAVVEAYVDGDEYSVPVWAGGETLPITQIRYVGFPKGAPKICSYRAKWSVSSWQFRGTPSTCPAPIDDALAAALRAHARRAYRAVGCTGYARVDFRVGTDGRLYVIEVNPNPDISPGAGFVRAALHAGHDYTEMIKRIVDWTLMNAQKESLRAAVTSRRRATVSPTVRMRRQKQAWNETEKTLVSGSN